MDMATPYLGFIITAYGLFAVVLLGLLAQTIWRGKNLRRELAKRGLNDPGTATGTDP